MNDGLSEELRRLDDFLLGEAVGEESMLLSELDGFLTGLVVCPVMITPGEWLPVVWGDDGPVFEDESQAQAILDLIMGHYNDIIRHLDQGACRPLYDVDNDDSLLWETWIEGFWEAVLLRPEAWLELKDIDDEDLDTAMFSLSRLYEIATTAPAELEPLEVDEELKDLAPDMIPHAVEILHRARLAHADPSAGPIKRDQPKVGRNDPCPCGSGKKYKRCCGRS